MAFDLEIFNKQVYTGMTETVDQQLDAFNEASNNTLVLTPSSSNMGDYAMEASFKTISGLVRRRNAANGSGSVTATNLQQLKKVSVKVAAGTPPITFEPSQYRWILESPERAAVIIGDQLAKAMLADQLNTAITGLVAAISGNLRLSRLYPLRRLLPSLLTPPQNLATASVRLAPGLSIPK